MRKKKEVSSEFKRKQLGNGQSPNEKEGIK